jgi:cytochrome oxidase Cu insertion factor (SCO1/SenC/PrrC family)
MTSPVPFRRRGLASAWVGVAVISVLALLGGAVWLATRQEMGVAGQIALLSGYQRITGTFALIAPDGRLVRDSDFVGKLRLITFGFVSCPDVCPTQMQRLADTMQTLAANQAVQVQPLFITLDPAHDEPARLAAYTAAFHPAILGLSGSQESVEAAARAFNVYYARTPGTMPGEADRIDHGIFIYLMGRKGELMTLFGPEATPETMAATIHTALQAAPPAQP